MALRITRTVVGLLCGALLMTGELRAQSLPRWTADLSVGAGIHTTRAGAEYFHDDTEGVGRIGASYRIMGASKHALYATLDFTEDWDMGEKLSCRRTPTNGCYHSFKPGDGTAVGLAVRQVVVPRLTVGAGAGLGQYGDGAVPGGIRPHVDAEASLRLFSHASLFGTWRYVRWSGNGTAYWFAPLTFGVRVH